MLTKKDYKAIADVIYIQWKEYSNSHSDFADGYTQGCEDVSSELADYFERDNPNIDIDKEKFLKDCGVK